MSPGGADRYEHLEIRIVQGHNPDLVVLKNDIEVRRVDLTKYRTEAELHALLLAEGFAPRADSSLRNNNEQCYAWRHAGECLKNPVFMEETCALACHNLTDQNEHCVVWAAAGECESNSQFMLGECPVSCARKQEL